jgi:hypothetical protein
VKTSRQARRFAERVQRQGAPVDTASLGPALRPDAG